DGDPVVIFDKIAQRWFIGQFSVGTTPYLYCAAVSTTADPTGTYYRYSFNYGGVNFPDYPKVGVWPDAYYTTFNIFANGQNFTGAQACAYDRTSMLAGRPATQQCFSTGANYGGLLPADQDGSVLPPVGAPNYMLALGITNSELAFWKFHVDWATPANSTFTGPANIAVSGFSPACGGGTCIPQKGTTQLVDSLADRVMYRLSYRNYGDHESLYVNHSVTAGSSVGARWYEIRNPATTPTVYQQGTYAPDARFRWMGSIASDKSGDLALGYSLSSTTDYPSISYTGRVPGDTLGTLETESSLFVGTGSQTGGLSRWGDYSSMSVDPADDCTFWYTTEYIPSNGSFNWGTRIGSFAFPACGGQQAPDYSLASSPSTVTVAPGSAASYRVTATSVNNFSGNVNFTVAGLPASSSAAFSPNPLTVPAGGSAFSGMTVSTTSNTPVGSYPLTLTGTSGTLSHTNNVTLVVATQSGSVTLAPATTNFYTVSIGSTTPNRTLTLTNGQSVPLNISSVTITGDYARNGGTCAATLAARRSCTILVNFTPTAVGVRPGTVTVADDGVGSPQSASLTGSGMTQTTLTPTSIGFSAQAVGTTSGPRTAYFRNNQLRALTISSVVGTGDFAYSGGSCPLAPATLVAGKTCTINVVFTPTQVGPRTGVLTINDDATEGPRTISLSGSGK
ncbi:MAG: choice-of-anchor D domain-containing protein, partial [Acidobacteriaceae bacterium]